MEERRLLSVGLAGVHATKAAQYQTPAGLPGEVPAALPEPFAPNYAQAATALTPATSGPIVTTFVSSGLDVPFDLTFAAAGNLYVANFSNSTIAKVTTAGPVSTFVSGGLDEPAALAFDAAGNLYVANYGNSTISKVMATALNITNATTGEDMQTTSGLAITPNAADAGTVTCFQISNITNGFLFLNDGVTPVTNGEFITVAQGAAGLKFTPTTGSLANGGFTAEESTTGTTAGLIPASASTATITVLAPSFENVPTLLHGVATVSWTALGYNPATITVDITAYQVGQTIAIAADQPVTGSCNWNTTSLSDGQYELRAVIHDASGNVVGQCQQQVTINNTAAWYSGTIATNETWTSAQVNVVSGNVTILSGVTVTVQPGAIVKCADGTGITIQSGGTLNAAVATSAAPIIFTSLEDDAAGGDTNMDGDARCPCRATGAALRSRAAGRSFSVNTRCGVRR